MSCFNKDAEQWPSQSSFPIHVCKRKYSRRSHKACAASPMAVGRHIVSQHVDMSFITLILQLPQEWPHAVLSNSNNLQSDLMQLNITQIKETLCGSNSKSSMAIPEVDIGLAPR